MTKETQWLPDRELSVTESDECTVAAPVNWFTREGAVMGLGDGRLARIDRRVFAALDHTAGVQTVKVPVSAAVWSTWRRYCEALGVSMGEGVSRLIAGELATVVDETGTTAAELADQLAQRATERSTELDARQQQLEARSAGLRRREQSLRTWEQELRASRPAGAHAVRGVKVGRNERCPCGSGLKYKHCHGGPLRPGP